jgi:ribosome-associated toxin RatA of RatAB toxin-antitoxin module
MGAVIFRGFARLGAAIIASLFLAGIACAQPSPDIRFSVVREDDVVVIEARVDLPVPAELVWSVLTDYEHYPDFITSMREARIVSRGPQGVVVDTYGSFSILFFSQPVAVRLLVTEFPPSAIETVALAGDFRFMRGRYELKRLGNGVRLSYTGRLQPDFSLPPIFGTNIVHYLLFRNFRELVDEILRRGAAEGHTPGVANRRG